MKKLAILGSLLLLLVTAAPAMAASAPRGASQSANAGKLPETQEVVFVDYAQHDSPPPATDQDKSFRLFRHASWAALPIAYKINTMTAPVSGAVDAVKTAFETWDAATSAEVFNDTVGTTDKTGYARDSENIISWAYIDGNGAIVAITHVWFTVLPGGWQVVEFDMIFDSGDSWAIGAEANKFDVENVATHEAGHTVFLNDLYLWKTAELTMYGYVAHAEIKKQTLGGGDVLGIQKLFGE